MKQEEIAHPNFKFLSHSATVLLEACPRLFELDRLSQKEDLEGEDVHLDFGKLVGAMIQDYLVTGRKEIAIWKAFLSYPRPLLYSTSPSVNSEEEEAELKAKKNFFFAMIALDKFEVLRNEELSSYYVPHFNGKPAVELGFIINCPGGFQYRGKLDALIVHKDTGRYGVLEVKTTGSNYLNEAMYRNSGQGIGYSAIVDTIASSLGLEERSSFPIFYPVYQTRKLEWKMLSFLKSRSSTANWIRHLLRSIQHISEYAEDNYFPMHGQSCFSYNKPCRFFEVCEMQTKHVVGPLEKVVVKKDKEEDYPFVFSLDQLIETQLEKISREGREAVGMAPGKAVNKELITTS
jgi:hypothetical protein